MCIRDRRWIYPHYRHDEFVEVSDEVWEVMRQAQREMNNYERRKVYHRAYYSLDAYSWTENYALEHGSSPEEYLCRMETLDELLAVLDTCTEAQRRRFLLYALDGLTLAEIGTVCGCSKVAVYQSVEAVRKKFIKFFENRLNEDVYKRQDCNYVFLSPIYDSISKEGYSSAYSCDTLQKALPITRWESSRLPPRAFLSSSKI